MAVTFDAVGPSASGIGGAGVTSLTWTHTPVASGTLVIVQADCDVGSAGFSMSATYGGTSMTSLGTQATTGGASNGFIQMWWILTSGSAAATVVVTAAGGTPSNMEAGSIGCAGAASVGTAVGANTVTGTNCPVTVTGVASTSLVVGCCGAGDTITAIATGTSRFLINQAGSGGNNTGNLGGGTNSGSGSVTLAWTNTLSGVTAAMMAVEVKAAASGISGSRQPRATVPVPRRRLSRAVVAGSKPFTGFVKVAAPHQAPYLPPRRRPARAVVEFTPVTTTNKPVGVVQPWATVPIRRRVLQRAVVAHVYGAAYVKVPAPLQGPYLPPRRRPARAVVAGSRPFLGFVAVPAPLQGPYLPPRRVPARAVWRGSAPFLGFVAVPAPRQSPYLPPRRVPGRAVVEFTPVTPANAAPAVPVPPRQQPGPAPRRIPARAVVEFTPVTTTNSTAAPPSGTVQPWPTVPIRRRQLQRAVIAHAYGAGYVAVPAPRQSPYLPPRRTLTRATIAHAYGSAFVAVPAPRQQPGPAPRRHLARAYIQFRPVRTSNGTAVVLPLAQTASYDGKTWLKKQWILGV